MDFLPLQRGQIDLELALHGLAQPTPRPHGSAGRRGREQRSRNLRPSNVISEIINP